MRCVSVRVRFLHRRSRHGLFLNSISVFGCDRATDLRKYGTRLASKSARLARVRARARITFASSQVAWSRLWTSLQNVVTLNGTLFFNPHYRVRFSTLASKRQRRLGGGAWRIRLRRRTFSPCLTLEANLYLRRAFAKCVHLCATPSAAEHASLAPLQSRSRCHHVSATLSYFVRA